MATSFVRPGNYAQELPNALQSIAGVPTAITAFVGHTSSGIEHQAQDVFSFADFERLYGGLAADSVLSYAVQQFFQNGGAHAVVVRTSGADGGLPATADIIGDQAAFSGLYALLKVDLFNLLCIPDATRASAADPTVPDPGVDANAIYGAAMALCEQRRAFLLIDPPVDVATVAAAADWKSQRLTVTDANGAAFFPRLNLADSLNDNRLRGFAPCGVVAGVYATTDARQGVWKSPAGTGAVLKGVQGMACQIDDQDNDTLNALAVNCFRSFPNCGPVLWGARTLAGADAMASEWRYVPVRRTALFIEESVFRGTQWAVSEPNGEPLWASIRSSVSAFMQGLFLKGAFQGSTPTQAYFVKCDSETMTQTDIDNGVVNILVGFAAQSAAEFLVLRISQTAQAARTPAPPHPSPAPTPMPVRPGAPGLTRTAVETTPKPPIPPRKT